MSALIGGVIFNAANILLVAAIDIAGMAVAFPVGIGLALVLGVVVNYIDTPVGDPVLLLSGRWTCCRRHRDRRRRLPSPSLTRLWTERQGIDSFTGLRTFDGFLLGIISNS